MDAHDNLNCGVDYSIFNCELGYWLVFMSPGFGILWEMLGKNVEIRIFYSISKFLYCWLSM